MSLYASVCNNTVVMWPLFIELIVSFYLKITQGKFLQHRENSGKTQGISFWLECGHPAGLSVIKFTGGCTLPRQTPSSPSPRDSN